jgi:hypothetical protein
MSKLQWYNAVKSGGQWDFKNSQELKKQFPAADLDAFGNFHFGVVARAQGFGLETAMSGAGAYQSLVQGGGSKIAWYLGSKLVDLTAFGALLPNSVARAITKSGFTWGDNPGDSINIMNGWDYEGN